MHICYTFHVFSSCKHSDNGVKRPFNRSQKIKVHSEMEDWGKHFRV